MFRMLRILVVAGLILPHSNSFLHKHMKTSTLSRKDDKPLKFMDKQGDKIVMSTLAHLNHISPSQSTIIDIISMNSAVNIKDILAKGLGYVMGLGALLVYAPIVINLLKSKTSEGYSFQTWIFNIIGLVLAVTYPLKKHFLVSTYVELILVAVQSIGILGLMSFYGNKMTEYLFGMFGLIVSLGIIYAAPIPANVLNSIQLFSILICNYANIPQILLSVRYLNYLYHYLYSLFICYD